ncbi:MAG: glycine cleavage system aminomethyltransferase GcvT [Myxococcales bacterium]|nr:glycine cleavage system aminomethyltransferase GcvT [Myxococcales bacterium]
MSPDPQHTPLHEAHQALGARFVPFAGYEMPVQYPAGITREHQAVRQAAGLFDVSHMGELFFEGEGAARSLDAWVTGDIKGLEPGQARYTLACNQGGTILDDLIVYRLSQERVMVVCNASNRAKMRAHFAPADGPGCRFEDRSDAYALIALQGPRAEAVLRAAGAPETATTLPRFGLTEFTLLGSPTIAARTGYTGEDGFELFCPPEAAPALWRKLLQAGEAEGIAPVGLGARDTLRLEARLMLYGNDIDETTNPYEAGLGWCVKLDKGDFLGRDALVAIKKARPERKLVGFEMRGRGIARRGYAIVDPVAPDSAIGSVTSGAPALSLGKNIGLGYVPRALSKRGTPLGIEIRGKVIDAMVVPTPFYKRES